jgi:hypothetical protein
LYGREFSSEDGGVRRKFLEKRMSGRDGCSANAVVFFGSVCVDGYVSWME